MERHEKAPVRCPCSHLPVLHGAPRTLLFVVLSQAPEYDLQKR